MTTSLVCQTHAIAPSRVIRGEQAWQQSLPAIADLCQRPALLGRSPATQLIRAGLKADLSASDLQVVEAQLQFDCCEDDLDRLQSLLQETACDAVVAAGGGKVLDAGKLLACRLKLPCITVPLSAATCAGWTALANIYTPDGAFVCDEALDACPDLLIFDHGLIRQAPNQTLSSGIADALAKWYEASVGSGCSTDGIIQQAVQMARVLRDQLLIDAHEAMAHPERGLGSGCGVLWSHRGCDRWPWRSAMQDGGCSCGSQRLDAIAGLSRQFARGKSGVRHPCAAPPGRTPWWQSIGRPIPSSTLALPQGTWCSRHAPRSWAWRGRVA